ncbi:rRNA maturation RNase YbeY [Candidatus Falkowbacteria bacterium CG10_big_fil_rev_8_21_14_0_10_39_9]|uniref:Endoribonuclease YbeY n=1 Tax=Candidatus Falkowbacteria bacterium CG10_big_fil_rev_8_21_14_0_10_39_9 TaxID=1974566 RepID=A0A2M6WNR6_9BACT|nr:MAG: rRNA maturation RNase YbeY [Candidatus Falkowbacteria bacterium CG10_big_fil_rev_8_21_14_0_10_39_9]
MIEINNTTKVKIPALKLRRIIEKFILAYKLKDFSVSVAIIGDSKMRELNYTYRGYDKPTDVLSFTELNEIIIDIQVIKRQAKELSKSWESELIFILVHGLLHLIGYDDNTESKRLKMIAWGEDFLRLL